MKLGMLGLLTAAIIGVAVFVGITRDKSDAPTPNPAAVAVEPSEKTPHPTGSRELQEAERVGDRAREEDLELPDVLALVATHLQEIQNIRYNYTSTYRFSDANQTVRKTDFAIDWDQKGRQYVKKISNESDPATITVWNGERQKYLIFGGSQPTFGRISNRQPSAMNSVDNPINTSIRFLSEDTLQKLTDLKSKLLRVERQGKDRLYVVQFERRPPTPEKGENTVTIWFSSLHRFAAVKRLVVINGSPWTEVTVTDLTEVQPGIWLPLKLTCKNTPKEGEESVAEAVVDRESYAVNTDLGVDTFDIKFPRGTRINDDIAGKTYFQD